ncbi:hypothetical protein BBD42_15360 [Paenibacillus sp. BIHB 4019]|uniref:Toprim domain-containing protein n=1 Tax=Paenibacillus sp. BIHB 4019 TaxID=1870819 RepID=A0A1B2DJ19_9BACL|nr:toprim domain-containing protein [Paenibacillus sp. BIHB 4019]ANY67689.1 hypothetical protein BBD42_15360 [Paenibacillus sp. BIHB 4019]
MIDVRAELEEYEFNAATWTDTRLLAASPFRYDRHPSFYVILDADDEAYGCWGDSGANDPEWQRGGFVMLLAFLRNETSEEAREYLDTKYGSGPEIDSAEITLRLPKLKEDKPRITRIDERILDEYKFRHPYLERRGISEPVQRLMNVGYDRDRQAITLPWYNADGTLGNVKYRRIDSKTFWYTKGGRPIREMLYGIHIAYGQKLRKAALVEAEIDAQTLMSAGIFTIATGGSAFTEAKRDLLLRSPIEEVTLWRDNDAAGRKWRNKVATELNGHIDVKLALMRGKYKDVNECACNGGNIRQFKTRNCRNLSVNLHCCQA